MTVVKFVEYSLLCVKLVLPLTSCDPVVKLLQQQRAITQVARPGGRAGEDI